MDPEQNWYVEAGSTVRPHPLVALRLDGYFRVLDGMIRLDATRGKFINLDRIAVRGIEVGTEIAPGKPIGGGIEYLFGDASSPTLGSEPLFNFPRHRVQAWIASTFRRCGGWLRLRYVSDRIDMGERLGDYFTVDASLWLRAVSHLFLAARVDNLLDARYAERAGLAAQPITLSLFLEGLWP